MSSAAGVTAGAAAAGGAAGATAVATGLADRIFRRVQDSTFSERFIGGSVALLAAYYLYRRHVRTTQRAEFQAMRRQLTDQERQIIAFIFHRVDSDSDMTLSRTEFKQFVEKLPALSGRERHQALEAFDLFDLNDDGVLSLPEFEEYFRAVKNMAGDDVLEMLLKEYLGALDALQTPAREAGGTGRAVKSDSLRARMNEKPADEFEAAIMEAVIPAGEVNVPFSVIGSLAKPKAALRELVIYPLRHPEFFAKGLLRASVKGILLFGPPGNGKTLLAKAVATECNATFINVSATTLGSKWYGDSEKYARALFAVARKMAPTVIFIDEIDSLLHSRDGASGTSVLRSVQTTLMTEWDGLTGGNERIVVLGATNRPFDLDEAILRRMPRRLFIDLPDKDARVSIIRNLVKDDKLAADVNLSTIADKTNGFSGSDLQNLCREAAMMRVREAFKASEATEESKDEAAASKTDDVELRPISAQDFLDALKICRASVSEASEVSQRLKEWNEQYGDFGAKKPNPSTFMLYS